MKYHTGRPFVRALFACVAVGYGYRAGISNFSRRQMYSRSSPLTNRLETVECVDILLGGTFV